MDPVHEPPRLRDLLGGAGRKLGMADAVEAAPLWQRWSEIVGSHIARHARPTSLRGGVLRVEARTPVWATEVGYLADDIRTQANAALGRDVVSEVRIWVTRDPSSGDSWDDASAADPRTASEPVPQGRVREAASDPHEALGRAHAAWLRRRVSRASRRGSRKGPDHREKPW